MKNLSVYVRVNIFMNISLPLVILTVLSAMAVYYIPDKKDIVLAATAAYLGISVLYTASPLPMGNFHRLVKDGRDDLDIRRDFVKAPRYDNISIGHEYMFILGKFRLFILPLDSISRAYGLDNNRTTFIDHGSYKEEKHNTDSFIILLTKKKKYRLRVNSEKRTWLLNSIAMNAPDVEIGYDG